MPASRPRIAIAGFHHETNSFARNPATYADYERPDAWPGLTRGADLLDALAGQNIPVSGFLAAVAERGWTPAPLLWANAGPSGPVAEDAYERIADEIVGRLLDAGPVDGLYLCLHGAMVPEHVEDGDGEGELLRRIRAVAGRDLPVVASLDLHANLTRAMVANADGLVAFRTYPHVDMAETGARTAALLDHILAHGPPATAMRKGGYLVPVSAMSTLAEPARGLYAALAGIEAEEGAVSASLTLGFPPADIAECGPAVLVHADTQARAEALADLMEARFSDAEPAFRAPLLAPGDAVAKASGGPAGGGPVILADTQDNPGGGGPGDGTAILAALVAADVREAVLGLLWDPATAAAAHQGGIGATLDLPIGAKSGIAGNEPVRGPWRVEALSAAPFPATGSFLAGSRIDLGPMAVLAHRGVRVVVSSVRMQAVDPNMFRHLGVEPRDARILVLKSSVHFRADFAGMAADILVVEAPGPNVDDPAKLPYRRLRSGVRRRPGEAMPP